MGNKVKYNLKNVHAAKLTETVSKGVTTYTYATPQAIPGAVSISLDAEGDSSPFYIVGRFFEKPCRFSVLNVAVRGWREKTRKDLRQTEEHRRKRDAKTFSEKCRFGGPKVAVMV